MEGKKTLDDVIVPDRTWYYLLDFNDRDDFQTICEMFPETKGRLSLLTEEQYWKLFKAVAEKELILFGK